MQNSKLFKPINQRIFRFYRKAETQLHDLRYLFWECTLNCNIRCKHCGSDCHSTKSEMEMPAEYFLNSCRKIAEVYDSRKILVVITGGEPLLRKDLADIGKQLHTMGFMWSLVSNGLLLSKERLKSLVDAGLNSLTISLDGSEENHNWLRGNKGGFKMAEQAICNVLEYPHLTFDVVSCVNKRNLLELNALKNHLIGLGLKKWRLFTIAPIGRAKENKELFLDSDELKHLMEFIKRTRIEGKIDAQYGCEGYLGTFENEARHGFHFCRAGINIASILADGTIGVCPNNDIRFGQGNIYSDDFVDVWENKFSIYRDKKWLQTGKCMNCKEFKNCLGNGMHLHRFGEDEVLLCHKEMLL